MPQLVVDEFKRSQERVAETARKGLSTHLKVVKDAIRSGYAQNRRTLQVIDYLNDVSTELPRRGELTAANLKSIGEFLDSIPKVNTSDAARIRAGDRALYRKAPCHLEKNSFADALIIETYSECVRNGKPRDRFVFITHNKGDFSHPSASHKLPHPDLADEFSKIKSLYFISVYDFVRRFYAGALDTAFRPTEVDPEFRSLSDMLIEIEKLTKMVWYQRHKNREVAIQKGELALVTRQEWDENVKKNITYRVRHIIDDVWKGAQRAAQKTERALGPGNLPPWDDFEWGMINGKLSALRWALGEEWDMLGT